MSKIFWYIVFLLIFLISYYMGKTNGNLTANMLIATIIISILLLIILSIRLKEKFDEDDPMLISIKEELRLCFPEIDNTILLKGKKSYTINKKRIHLCLKDENGHYYDKNMLKYVTIHELAHVMCDEVGHTEKFYSIFNELLDKAHKRGIYDKSKPLIKDYCEYSME